MKTHPNRSDSLRFRKKAAYNSIRFKIQKRFSAFQTTVTFKVKENNLTANTRNSELVPPPKPLQKWLKELELELRKLQSGDLALERDLDFWGSVSRLRWFDSCFLELEWRYGRWELENLVGHVRAYLKLMREQSVRIETGPPEGIPSRSDMMRPGEETPKEVLEAQQLLGTFLRDVILSVIDSVAVSLEEAQTLLGDVLACEDLGVSETLEKQVNAMKEVLNGPLGRFSGLPDVDSDDLLEKILVSGFGAGGDVGLVRAEIAILDAVSHQEV